MAVTGGWHMADLPMELSDTPSKYFCCFPLTPHAQPYVSLRQDLCSSPIAQTHYNPVVGHPGL